MRRLHEGLKRRGVESKILCETSDSGGPDVATIRRWRWVERLLEPITHRLGLNDLHRISSWRIRLEPAYQEAQVVHFHGTHSGFLSYLALPALTRDKPAVLTLHDMWPFTGHCCYSFDCQRWKTGCGHCPYPDTYPPIARDNTALEWRLKNRVYTRSKLTVVTLCDWMTRLVRESMLRRFRVHQIPNGLDTDVYQPLDRRLCRESLGLPKDKTVLMLMALSLSDHRKGCMNLIDSLRKLPQTVKSAAMLLLVGRDGGALLEQTGMAGVDLGFVASDRLKALCYSSADLVLHPTRADNAPLVVQESLACGVPVVSFDVGGVSEFVRPGVTGYLARADDWDDFRSGVVQLMEDRSLREQMGHNCRRIAVSEYSLELQAERFTRLYQQVLND